MLTRPRGRLLASLVATALMALPVTLAPPAQAAPPPNDEITGATRIGQAPASHAFNSARATRDTTDRRCVGAHSVWFRLRATSDELLRLTTAGSVFDTRLAVFAGPRRSLRLIACNDDGPYDLTSSVRAQVRADHVYWIAISHCCGGRGGKGHLTVGRVSPAGMDVTVEEARSGGVSGRLLLSGTMTCTSPSLAGLEVFVSQRVGQGVARGSRFDLVGLCDTNARPWELFVDSDTGWAFQPDDLVVDHAAAAWNGFTEVRDEGSVVLTAVDDPLARTAR